MSIDLKAVDRPTLIVAIKSLGFQHRVSGNSIIVDTDAGRITIKNGKAECDSYAQKYVNQIKKAYSLKTIERISQKYKFNLVAKQADKVILRRY
jgi:hypothetical protein